MDKKIIEQLRDLQSYKPDPSWKKNNRELLLSQISASSLSLDENLRAKFNLFSFSFFKSMPQPMMAAFLIIAILIGGGMLSFSASKNAIPGDSLYIAKKINEKAKLVITFDEKKKTRLGLEFAQERVAEIQEILKVEGNGNKEERVNKLVDEVRKEIKIAQNRMNDVEESSNLSDEDLAQTEILDESDETQVFSASLEKEEKGLQVSGIDGEEETVVIESSGKENDVVTKEVEIIEATDSASSSDDVDVMDDTSTTSSQLGEEPGDEEIMQTINELVADLEDAIDRINENGEVKGVSEGASSTENMIIE